MKTFSVPRAARRILRLVPSGVLLCGLPALALFAASCGAADRIDLALVGGNVVPMTSDTVLAGHTILIAKNRIVAVGPAETTSVPAGATSVDITGRFVIPGLWDMHTHILPDREGSAAERLSLLVANGVTGVRDMGGHLDSLRAVRRRMGDRRLLPVRLFAPGPILDGPRFRRAHDIAVYIPDTDRAALAVDSLQAAGVDFIKVYGSLSRDVFFALAWRATAAGLPIAGHVPTEVTASEVSDAGMASIEHLEMEMLTETVTGGAERIRGIAEIWSAAGYDAYFAGRTALWEDRDSTAWSRLVAHLSRNGTWVTPTLINEIKQPETLNRSVLGYMTSNERGVCQGSLAMYGSTDEGRRNHYYATLRAMLADLHQGGVRILAGSDAPGPCVVPGFGLHDELALLVEAGLSPYEALQAATSGPAAFVGMQDAGAVAEGRIADLVVLTANPIDDIHNTTTIEAVILDGRLYDRPALDALLAEAR